MSEKKYKCIENDEIFTESELRKQYEQFKKETNEEYYPETFEEYMNAALSKNGSLEEIASDNEIENRRRRTAVKIAARTGIEREKVLEILRDLNVHGNWTRWEICHRSPDIKELTEIVEEKLGYEMIEVYDVQTFYGTKAKTFQKLWHAQEYWEKLKKECECVDPITTRKVTVEHFCYENLAD